MAYVIILVMVAAVIAGIALIRYNSPDRKIARQREREDALREEHQSGL